MLDENNARIEDAHRLGHIGEKLRRSLARPDEFPAIVERRLPRRLKHFDVRTEVTLSNDLAHQRTMIEVITLDRPGLLARIGRIFMEHGVNLQNARIATLGERAEDVFFLTDSQQHPLSDPALCERLCEALRTQLDEPLAVTP